MTSICSYVAVQIGIFKCGTNPVIKKMGVSLQSRIVIRQVAAMTTRCRIIAHLAQECVPKRWILETFASLTFCTILCNFHHFFFSFLEHIKVFPMTILEQYYYPVYRCRIPFEPRGDQTAAPHRLSSFFTFQFLSVESSRTACIISYLSFLVSVVASLNGVVSIIFQYKYDWLWCQSLLYRNVTHSTLPCKTVFHVYSSP